MYQLKKFNVIKLTDSELKKTEYFSQGYELIEEKQEEPKGKFLEELTLEELIVYAETNNIDIGSSATPKGVLKKITEALEEKAADENVGNKS